MKLNFTLLMAILACGMLLSCDDDDKKEEPAGVAVKTVNATACVDLSNRSHWEFTVMYCPYDYTISGKGIQATIKDEPYHFDNSYPEGSHVSLGGGPVIRLVAPGYYPKVETKETSPTPPDISDQTTPEKLLKADVLSTYYSGNVSENLTGIELTHANALLEFDLVGVPTGSEVRVGSYMQITPYKESDNRYKAIVLAEGGEFDAYVAVQIDGTVHVVYILDYVTKSSPLTGEGYIQRDTRYTFTVAFDKEKNTLTIENLQRSKWSDKYPLELTFSNKQIAEFKLFIGSPDGPKEISTQNLDPAKFWGNRLTYYPTHIIFNDAATMTRLPKDTSADTFTYTFHKDSLFRYNKNVETWFWAGKGDGYNLTYHIGYYRCNYFDPGFMGGTGTYRFYIAQDNEWAAKPGFWGDMHSLSDLKQETDTIMWCNINYNYVAPLWDY